MPQHLWNNIDEISARIFEKRLSHKQKNDVEIWWRKLLCFSIMFEVYLNFEQFFLLVIHRRPVKHTKTHDLCTRNFTVSDCLVFWIHSITVRGSRSKTVSNNNEAIRPSGQSQAEAWSKYIEPNWAQHTLLECQTGKYRSVYFRNIFSLIQLIYQSYRGSLPHIGSVITKSSCRLISRLM